MFPFKNVAYISRRKQLLSEYFSNRISMLPHAGNHNCVVMYFALKIQKLNKLY